MMYILSTQNIVSEVPNGERIQYSKDGQLACIFSKEDVCISNVVLQNTISISKFDPRLPQPNRFIEHK